VIMVQEAIVPRSREPFPRGCRCGCNRANVPVLRVFRVALSTRPGCVATPARAHCT
jgi:hypothetical protein